MMVSNDHVFNECLKDATYKALTVQKIMLIRIAEEVTEHSYASNRREAKYVLIW